MSLFDDVDDFFCGLGLADEPAFRHETFDDRAVYTLEMPGVKRSDLEVAVDERSFTVSFKRHGRDVGRTFVVPTTFDLAGATAGLEDGVLTVTVPRRNGTSRRVLTVG